jgi:hypothetical protein
MAAELLVIWGIRIHTEDLLFSAPNKRCWLQDNTESDVLYALCNT